jgi:hypothetical protein
VTTEKTGVSAPENEAAQIASDVSAAQVPEAAPVEETPAPEPAAPMGVTLDDLQRELNSYHKSSKQESLT